MRLPLVHSLMREDAHRVDAILDIGGDDVLADAARDVGEQFVDFLGRGGIEVTAMGSQGIVTAAEVGSLGRSEVEAIVAGADVQGAQAVLVPDTAMHTLSWLDRLEKVAGMPVLTANQVTGWEGLRLADADRRVDGFGALLRAEGIPG